MHAPPDYRRNATSKNIQNKQNKKNFSQTRSHWKSIRLLVKFSVCLNHAVFFFLHAFPLFFHVESKNSNSSRTIWSFFVSSKQMCINSIVLVLTGFRVAWSYIPTIESAAENMLVNGGVLLPSARGQFDLSGTNLIVRLLSRSDAGIASGCALILFYRKFLCRNSSFNLALGSILRFYCFFFS